MSTTASVSRKRKRDEEKVLLGDAIVIQPHLTSVFDTSIKITPTVLFPKKKVPFSWLTGIPSRLFSADIPALDSPGNILITKTDGERQLSAVEKVSEGAFALFKLSPLVKLKDVRRLVLVAKKAASPDQEQVDPGKEILGKDWWKNLVLRDFTPGVGGPEGYTAVLSMIHPSVAKKNFKSPLAAEAFDLRPISPPAEIIFKEPTPAEVLEQTRAQYLEALYVTKTSIAYFAKSTLSRARVKFQEAIEETTISPASIGQLVEFLQSMIIPLVKMDIKYRKVILQVATEEDIQDTIVFKAGEEFYVQRWLSVNFRGKVLQSTDPALKRQIEDLKIRETELQIIILLEILALTKDMTPPAEEPEEDSKNKIKSKKKSSSKKKSKGPEPPDPAVLLDLLLDRLCIWRSITSLDLPTEGEGPNSSHSKDGEDDRFRNFCMEVVMPFYSSRLPEICSMIQKKIGGISAPPGSTKKPPIDHSKRRKVPSLLRSKTTPVTFVSREPTPASLLALPKATPKATPKNVDLGAVAKKTLQKREIQMPALNVKTKANVDEELKDAIRNLAKPNRIAVGAEFMDAATKRMSAGGSSTRKQKKPVRNPNANNVLVHATPSKKNRLRQTVPVKHMPPQDEDEEDEDSLLPPPRPQSQCNQSHTPAEAVFDSPINGSYKSATLPHPTYLNNTSLATRHVDMVPNSSLGVLSTPLKGFSTIGKKTGQRLDRSLDTGYIDDDTIPESSPIKAKRSSGNPLAKSRSCLFPPSMRLESSPIQKPLVLGTPQKRKRGAIPFQEEHHDGDRYTEVEEHLPSIVLPSSVNQTPIRSRGLQLARAKTYGPASTVNPSAKLDFSALKMVAESPIKVSGGSGKGSWRDKSEGSSGRKSLGLDDNGEDIRRPQKKAVGKAAENDVMKEVDIYKSLGWDDEDPLI